MTDRSTPCIATQAGTAAMLERYKLRTHKSLGQHFLIDPHVLKKIIRAAGIDQADSPSKDFVLEIGPGIGGMTQALSAHAGQVCAVELDEALIPVLRDVFKDMSHVSIIHGDIMQTDIHELAARYPGMRGYKIVANLPYYATTPVLTRILSRRGTPYFESVTVMVQREAAERMTASPGTKGYGPLALTVGFYANVELVARVPRNCFMPRPHVDSAVLRLQILPEPRYGVDAAFLFSLIRAAFAQRRKTLANSLSAVWALCPEKRQVEKVLRQCGLAEHVRGETLSLAQFARLAEAFETESR